LEGKGKMKTADKETWELIPEDEFASLGIDDMAYVKLKSTIGKNTYSIHTADGSEVAVVESREVAFATITQNELNPLSVH
tara:strand:+ start:11983 stop:12222 length:240 start_codon:yes stop_codon:yes gene_type:complete